jgi:hypothetical protein
MKKAKATSGYWAKLKDPRWQKKRLEVMEYNDFACEHCGDAESTLNVHHKAYKKKADPWEYSIDELACLCETCHEEAHRVMAMVDDELFRFRTDGRFGDAHLLGYLQSKMHDGPFPVVCYSAENANGIVDGWRYMMERRGHQSRLAQIVCHLAQKSVDAGFGGEVWPEHFLWLASPNTVIEHLEYLLVNHPQWLIERCEGEYPGCPPDVAEQFIAKAKQALSEVTTG